MGLDMYLDKVKKVSNSSAKELVIVNNYLSWEESGSSCSFYEWCGYSIEEVNMDLVKEYRAEYIYRYLDWDKEHKYGHKGIFQSVCSWRKANQIHNWFVQNVQDGVDDCGMYIVTGEDFILLNNLCKKVLDSSKLVEGTIINGYTVIENEEVPIYEKGMYIEDPSVAKELLPTVQGFFFGSYEYDEWYYSDVKDTYDITKKILEETDFSKEIFLYSSSW